MASGHTARNSRIMMYCDDPTSPASTLPSLPPSLPTLDLPGHLFRSGSLRPDLRRANAKLCDRGAAVSSVSCIPADLTAASPALQAFAHKGEKARHGHVGELLSVHNTSASFDEIWIWVFSSEDVLVSVTSFSNSPATWVWSVCAVAGWTCRHAKVAMALTCLYRGLAVCTCLETPINGLGLRLMLGNGSDENRR